MENVTLHLNSIVDEAALLLTSYGLEVLGAILILIIGWNVAGWAQRATDRALSRVQWLDDTVRPLFTGSVRYLVLAVTIIAVLNQFGVETTSVIAVLGAAGLAIGLALQGTLSNVSAGVMLLFLRPFKVGDYIVAGGTSGTVKELGLFATELATPDNVFVSVPNSSIFGGVIQNFSHHGTRRLDIGVGVAYDADLNVAMKVLLETLEKDGRALGDPAPQVMVTELADSSVNLNLRFWVDAADFWPCKFDMTKGIKEALDAAGIEIPFPQRVIHSKNA